MPILSCFEVVKRVPIAKMFSDHGNDMRAALHVRAMYAPPTENIFMFPTGHENVVIVFPPNWIGRFLNASRVGSDQGKQVDKASTTIAQFLCADSENSVRVIFSFLIRNAGVAEQTYQHGFFFVPNRGEPVTISSIRAEQRCPDLRVK